MASVKHVVNPVGEEILSEVMVLRVSQDDEQRSLKQRLNDLAFRSNLASIAVSALSGFVLVAVLWQFQSIRPFLFIWAGALTLVSIARVAAHFYCAAGARKTVRLDSRKSDFWSAQISASLAISAGLWSCLTIGLANRIPVEFLFSIVLVIFCLSTGATGTLAPLKRPARLYFVFMLIPTSLALILKSDPHYVLGAAGFVFLLLNVLFHNANHQRVVEFEELQAVNGTLLKHLAREQSSLASLNEHLEEQVKERTASLRFLAHHDALTGLYNRAGLMSWVKKAADGAAETGWLAVLFIDLDRFKQINDALGHEPGDLVLKEVARRLSVSAPDGAAISRWGGDEFVVLLPQSADTAMIAGREVADDLRKHTEQPISIQGRELHVSFSAGVSVSTRTVEAVTASIKSADLAMGEVKRSHRGVTRIYSDELATKQERLLSIAQALKEAVPEKEFHIVAQPIVDARTLRPGSLEVLLRWKNPLLGPVGPDEFVPIAEDTGSIVRIGEFVLEQALKELSASDYGRSGGRIAINVSVRQLVDDRFAPSLLTALQKHGVDPGKLVVEVTETALDSYDLTDITASLRTLADQGVEIQVDDFGTGYSSLSRLHRLPISALKIDRSFVLNMDKSSLAVIEGSVLIARKSGLKVIAEGVETGHQADMMRDLGVDFLQGYYFGRPEAGLDVSVTKAAIAAPDAVS